MCFDSGIERLGRLLTWGSERARCDAAAVLAAVAGRGPQHRERIAAADCVKPLLQMLAHAEGTRVRADGLCHML